MTDASATSIDADVGIGSGVVILPNVKVGRGATIGPGCVVYRSVRAGATLYTPLPKTLRLNKD